MKLSHWSGILSQEVPQVVVAYPTLSVISSSLRYLQFRYHLHTITLSVEYTSLPPKDRFGHPLSHIIISLSASLPVVHVQEEGTGSRIQLVAQQFLKFINQHFPILSAHG